MKESKTQTEVIKNLGLATHSGNYQTLLKYIDLYKLDISHFEGKKIAYNKLKIYRENNLITNESFFVKGIARSSASMKRRIFKYKFKENICEECKCLPLWNNKILILQLVHINGDKLDNRLQNLRLLCPNCHSQTLTFSKGNRVSKKPEQQEKHFNIDYFSKNRVVPPKEAILNNLKHLGVYNSYRRLHMSKENFYALCNHYNIEISEFERVIKTENIDLLSLQKSILEKPLLKIAKDLNIADTALRKYVLKKGLFLPSSVHTKYWTKLQHHKINPVKFEHLTLHNGKYVLNNSYKKE